MIQVNVEKLATVTALLQIHALVRQVIMEMVVYNTLAIALK